MKERPPMGEKWTLESLYVYFSELRDTDIDRLKERFETQNRHVEVVATSVAARFIQGNEFRASLDDAAKLAARTLMPRTEADSRFASLEGKIEQYAKRIEDIERRLNIGEGTEHGTTAMRQDNIASAASRLGTIGIIVAAISVIVGAVVGHFWK